MNLAEKYAIGATTIMDWLGDGARPVEKELAQSRADICIACPHNKAGYSLATFAATVKFLMEIKKRERLRVDGEKSLGICEVCGCHIATSIWTPIEHIAQYTDTMPEHCWKTAEMHDL